MLILTQSQKEKQKHTKWRICFCPAMLPQAWVLYHPISTPYQKNDGSSMMCHHPTKTGYPPVNKHSNGKSPSWIGNTSSNDGFSIAMLDYRSVLGMLWLPPNFDVICQAELGRFEEPPVSPVEFQFFGFQSKRHLSDAPMSRYPKGPRKTVKTYTKDINK